MHCSILYVAVNSKIYMWIITSFDGRESSGFEKMLDNPICEIMLLNELHRMFKKGVDKIREVVVSIKIKYIYFEN